MIVRPALLALAALAALPAHAARPLVTDDAGVLGRGDCEWELVAVKPSGDARGWNTVGTCGVVEGLQLIGTYAQDRAGGATTHGLSLGAKKSLVDGGEHGISFTASAALNATRERDSGWRGAAGVLNLIATQPLGGGISAHANLGTLRERGGRDTTTWGLAAEHTGESGIDLMAEAYGDDRSSAPWLALGVRWNLSKTFNLNASWGRQGGADGSRLVTVGAKLVF